MNYLQCQDCLWAIPATKKQILKYHAYLMNNHNCKEDMDLGKSFKILTSKQKLKALKSPK